MRRQFYKGHFVNARAVTEGLVAFQAGRMGEAKGVAAQLIEAMGGEARTG